MELIESCFLINTETSLSHVMSSDGRGMVGVTVCGEKLFVLRRESKQRIEQYDVKTFNELTSITVNGLRDDDWWFKTLTSCNVNNCLYVNDESNVFRVDLSTNNVNLWRVDGRPCGLSVNRTSICSCDLFQW